MRENQTIFAQAENLSSNYPLEKRRAVGTYLASSETKYAWQYMGRTIAKLI
ncbi:MAG: hypothetical protein N4A71_07835 [Carboxylicivirga sp.]|jgi:hypothetical protein|nr:hypothetical protein [Carboxylicivirga sp.]